MRPDAGAGAGDFERWLIRHHPILVRVAGTNHRHRALCPQSKSPTNCSSADAHGNRKYGRKRRPLHWLQKRKGFSFQDVLVRGQSKRMRYRVEVTLCAGWFARHPPVFDCGGRRQTPQARRKNYLPLLLPGFCASGLTASGSLSLADLLAWLLATLGTGSSPSGHEEWLGSGRKAMLE